MTVVSISGIRQPAHEEHKIGNWYEIDGDIYVLASSPNVLGATLTSITTGLRLNNRCIPTRWVSWREVSQGDFKDFVDGKSYKIIEGATITIHN